MCRGRIRLHARNGHAKPSVSYGAPLPRCAYGASAASITRRFHVLVAAIRWGPDGSSDQPHEGSRHLLHRLAFGNRRRCRRIQGATMRAEEGADF
jgi:hypothetical protein